MPKNRVVVLGLISTKTPELESKEFLKRRIDEATAYVPLDRLCLSPQCGFSSAPGRGQVITEDDQKRKLERVAETAIEIWGTT
jgi:5-methyltetrahydropteroyltriglutamate--homocysteine methyltransferase